MVKGDCAGTQNNCILLFVEYLIKIVQTEKHVAGATNRNKEIKQRIRKRLYERERERDKATAGTSIFFADSLH